MVKHTEVGGDWEQDREGEFVIDLEGRHTDEPSEPAALKDHSS